MAKKVGDLLKDLLTKAGIDLTKTELKAIVELGEEMPDDVYDAVNKALMTVTAAQVHPEVTKKVKAEMFNGVDSKLEAIIAELGLEVDDDFKNDKNTFDKIGKLTKLAKAAGEKAKGTGGTKDKDEWIQKEKDFNEQIRLLKQSITDKEKTFNETRTNDQIENDLKLELHGKKYIFPDEMDASIKVNTALTTLRSELSKKGFSIKKNDAGALVILKADGTPAYSDTNVALEPKTFIDTVLAQNGLLKKNEETPPGGGAGAGGKIIPGGTIVAANTAIAGEIAAQMDEMGLKQ